MCGELQMFQITFNRTRWLRRGDVSSVVLLAQSREANFLDTFTAHQPVIDLMLSVSPRFNKGDVYCKISSASSLTECACCTFLVMALLEVAQPSSLVHTLFLRLQTLFTLSHEAVTTIKTDS